MKKRIIKYALSIVIIGVLFGGTGSVARAEEMVETAMFDTGKTEKTNSDLYCESDEEMDVLQAGNIAQGAQDGYTWVIDGNGKLIIRDDGSGNSVITANRDWKDYKDSIREVDIDVKKITGGEKLFINCSDITKAKISAQSCSGSFKYMFYCCDKLAELDITNMNTADVKDMSYMFSGCSSLTGLNLSNLNTGNVTNMSNMFACCAGLTELNLSNFDTRNVTNMSYLFDGCNGLRKLSVSIDTHNVVNMRSMFGYCNNLTELNLSNFNTGNVTNMYGMFEGCSGLTELNLSSFHTQNVNDMAYMFNSCSGLTKLNVSNFDTENVYYMYGMFEGCSSLTELNLGNLDTQNVGSMQYMFKDCSSLTELNISNLDTRNATDMHGMFEGCKGLTKLNLSGLHTEKVVNMQYMFAGCMSLTKLDLSSFNTGNVFDMSGLFYFCSGLTELNLSNFDTENVTNMSYMFDGCSGLTKLDVSKLNTAKVTNMNSMFALCSGLTELNLDSFDASKVTATSYMLYACSQLSQLQLPDSLHRLDYAFLGNCPKLKTLAVPSGVEEIDTKAIGYVGSEAEMGDMLEGYFIFNPESKVEDLALYGVKNSAIQAYAMENGFSFVEIKENPFADVNQNTWKYSFATYVFERQMMTGKGVNAAGKILFAPDDKLTRAELVQILYSLEGKPNVTYVGIFSDVKSTDWFRYAVLWANANGIANGVSDGVFLPNGNITREQVATMLKKYAQYKGYDTTATTNLNEFSDAANVSSWAIGNMSWAVEKGVISGKAQANGSKLLDPKGDATRAECAAMLKSFCEKVAGMEE